MITPSDLNQLSQALSNAAGHKLVDHELAQTLFGNAAKSLGFTPAPPATADPIPEGAPPAVELTDEFKPVRIRFEDCFADLSFAHAAQLAHSLLRRRQVQEEFEDLPALFST